MDKVENLNNFEKDILIKWFMYHMQWHDRVELMENLPMVYFKMTGVKAPIWKETTKENDNA
jgi:hypothetical protein